MIGLIHVSSPWVVPSAFTAEAVTFDGSNDWLYLNGDLTGISDGKTGLFSVFALSNKSSDGGGRIFWHFGNTDNQFGISWFDGVGDKIRIFGQNTTHSLILDARSDTGYTDADGWIHILLSWDLATTTMHLYVNDIEDLAASPLLTDDELDYAGTSPEWTVGKLNNTSTSRQFIGDMAELYFTTEYFDISIEANRRKFITVDGKPVDLGTNGENPTGTQAIVYYTGNASVWNAGTNAGSGGDFTMTGSVDDSSNEPVDVT